MTCGHGWHAYPPLVLGTSDRATTTAAPQAASVGIPFGAASGGPPEAPKQESRRQPGIEDEVATSGGMPGTAASSRTEQLAEIREMLAEVQAEDQAPPIESLAAAGSAAAGFTARTSSSTSPDDLRKAALASGDAPRKPRVDPEDEIDPLRAKLNAQAGKPAKGKEVDVKSLRKKHERRERTRKREKAAGSGAFLTGFLLVVMVAALMIGLYVLHPAIISRLPAAEPALTEYVATVDGLRVSVAETFEKAKGWVIDRSDKG